MHFTTPGDQGKYAKHHNQDGEPHESNNKDPKDNNLHRQYQATKITLTDEDADECATSQVPRKYVYVYCNLH